MQGKNSKLREERSNYRDEKWEELRFKGWGTSGWSTETKTSHYKEEYLFLFWESMGLRIRWLEVKKSVLNLSNWQCILLLLLSCQLCRTLCDPIDGSPPGSPTPGILQQEHWSGLPFPSPMHESEKWKWSHSVVSDSSRPHGRFGSRPP